MKKFIPVILLAVTFAACNDSETKPPSDTDSLAAAATADSLAALNTVPDTTMKPMDTTTMKMDTTLKPKMDSVK